MDKLVFNTSIYRNTRKIQFENTDGFGGYCAFGAIPIACGFRFEGELYKQKEGVLKWLNKFLEDDEIKPIRTDLMDAQTEHDRGQLEKSETRIIELLRRVPFIEVV